jgi:hypothetical protein
MFLNKNPHCCGFLLPVNRLLSFRYVKPTLLNHPKHISDILNKDPSDIGNGVDVVLGVVRQAGAGHQIQVFEDGIEAFADAVMEFA